MNVLQKNLLKMMKDIEKIVNNTNLKYSLSSGTALGWARAKTFIPWDDDLDYEVHYKDYDSFISLLEKKLPKNYAVFYPKKTKRGACSYAKVFDLNADIKIFDNDNKYYKNKLFIDIFKVMPVRNEVVKIYKKNINKLGKKFGIKSFPINIISKMSGLFINVRKTEKHIQEIENKIIDDNGKYWITNWFGYKPWDSYLKNHDFITKKIMFEGVKTKIWKNYDGYLKSIYGANYITPPKKKVTHGIKMK